MPDFPRETNLLDVESRRRVDEITLQGRAALTALHEMGYTTQDAIAVVLLMWLDWESDRQARL